MATVGDVEDRIAEIEGFPVQFRNRHGRARKIRRDKQGLPEYDYEKGARGTWTVQEWHDKRFKRLFPNYDATVYTFAGVAVTHWHTQLRTLRRN